ncbi:MAG: class I SAM-dependent methyltransferase, partial [Planctomycetota bacterium]
VDFCNARLARRGLPESAFVADMSDFSIADVPAQVYGRRRPFQWDVAFNTINSFRHLQTARQATAHLRCMGDVIRKGGLYLLGVHLTPTTSTPSDGEAWSAARGQLSVSTRMWTNDRDPKARIERFGIQFLISTPSKMMTIDDELVLRSYTMAQMNRFLGSVGQIWEVCQTYCFAYKIDDPLTVSSSTEDVVYVLRRK